MEIDWTIVSCAIGGIAFACGCVRNIKQDFTEKMSVVSNKSDALRNEMLYLHKEVKAEFKELKADIKDLKMEVRLLREDIKEVDRGVCHLEGAFRTKECCMLSHSHSGKEAG